NHCPYCLWSCHLDLYTAGDRLSACKAPMKPIGLTMKSSRNKYQSGQRGELMLIHECDECKSLSINRIAADDDPETILAVFETSLGLGHQIQVLYEQHEIVTLNTDDIEIVYTQLYGQNTEIPAAIWR
ncbi:MAG: RNHCP domain-containing protein, partial [Anaerolineales bacterium]|nr:RNHCP domain-containing protein [Anaerolineales bacterium]